MDLKTNSSESMISLERYTISNIKYKEKAKKLIFNLPETLEATNKNDNEMKVNEDVKKLEVLKKLNDVNQTVTINNLIHLTNIKSKIEKKAFKKMLDTKEKIIPYNIVDGDVKSHFIRYKLDLEEMKYIKLSTKIKNKQWENINSRIIRDNNDYICKVRQLRQVKKSFLQFIDYKENQVKNIKDEVNTEIVNTKALKDELEECTRDHEVVENEKLRLLKRLIISEGCYMVLTWLSPPEWKTKFKINKLNHDFVEPDSDFNKKNNDDYMSYAYQKLLEEFTKKDRLEPVLEMYWKSEEQFTKKLVMLDKKTRDNMSILYVIDNFHKISNNKQKYNDSRRKYENKLKQNIVSNIDVINQILTSNHQTNLKNIKSILYNDTLFNIKLMAVEINATLNKPSDENLTRPSKVIESLFHQLNESLNDSDEFQKPLWQKTEQILKLIEESEAKKYKNTKLKYEAVKLTQREANKIFNLTIPNVRKQKLLPNRLMIPKQKPPKKPKKPRLNNEQLMYLKCYTYLSPTDITSNDITLVPEIKTN